MLCQTVWHSCFFNFLPLSHTSLTDRYFQENSFKRFFCTFHDRNCLLACLTCQVDTRHTESHSHIFLMSLCYDAVSNCPVGKRTMTFKKSYEPPSQPASQSASQSAFPSHPAVTLAVWAYRLVCVRAGKLGLEARHLSFWPEWLLYIKLKLSMKPVILYQKNITTIRTKIELDNKTSKLSKFLEGNTRVCKICVHKMWIYTIYQGE